MAVLAVWRSDHFFNQLHDRPRTLAAARPSGLRTTREQDLHLLSDGINFTGSPRVGDKSEIRSCVFARFPNHTALLRSGS